MADEVNQLPSSPRENPPKVDPSEVSPKDDSLDNGDHGWSLKPLLKIFMIFAPPNFFLMRGDVLYAYL